MYNTSQLAHMFHVQLHTTTKIALSPRGPRLAPLQPFVQRFRCTCVRLVCVECVGVGGVGYACVGGHEDEAAEVGCSAMEAPSTTSE